MISFEVMHAFVVLDRTNIYLLYFCFYITGTIPLELNKLSQLSYFNVYSNSLTGKCSFQHCKFILCQFLLSSTMKTGTIPSALGNLYAMSILILAKNKIHGIVVFVFMNVIFSRVYLE